MDILTGVGVGVATSVITAAFIYAARCSWKAHLSFQSMEAEVKTLAKNMEGAELAHSHYDARLDRQGEDISELFGLVGRPRQRDGG